jgi:Zn-dependent M32 family carboxypeptidase
MKEIKAWFDEKDFPYDWMDPADWIKQVTGKPLDPSYYIAYLDQKF